MTASTKSADMMYYAKSSIGLLLMFGFGYLPAFGPVTPTGMQIIGIFLGLIWLWSTVEVVWPSILGVVALGMSDYCTMKEAVANGLGNSTVWQLIMIMALIGGINASGCGEKIARWMMGRKFLEGHPMRMVLTFFYVFMIMGSCIGGLATTLLAWAMCNNICKLAGYKKGDTFLSMMTVGLFVGIMMGATIIPFRGIKLTLLSAFANISGSAIQYIPYMIISLIMCFSTMTIYALAMKYVFRADFSLLKNADLSSMQGEEKLSLTFHEKAYFSGFAAILLFIFAESMFPATWPLMGLVNSISSTSVFAVVIVVLSIMRKDGKAVLSYKEMAKYIEWNTIFICCSAIQLANALVAESTGVKLWMSELLSPIFSGTSPFMFVAIMIVMAMLLTNIANNMAVGLTMLPIIIAFANEMSLNVDLVAIILILIVQIGYMLPGASAPAPLLHSNENLTEKEVFKYGGFIFITLMLLMIVVIYPIANFII